MLLLLLLLPGTAGGGTVRAERAAAPGQLDFGISTRTFDSPLFGDDRATTYRFFGRQSFPAAGDYQLWIDGGLSGYETHYGLRGEGLRAGGQLLGFVAGDYALDSLDPDPHAYGPRDSFPLRGVRLRGRGAGFEWSAFGGRAAYDLSTPGDLERKPALYGAQFLKRRGANSFGADLVVVDDAPFADPARGGVRDAVWTGRYFRELTPWTRLTTEAFAGSRGSGARLGAGRRLARGEVSAALYTFDDGLPYVYPLFRPGERGIELRGRYRVAGWASTHGSVYYATDDAVRERDELRGSAGATLDFGASLPALSIDYSHDDVVYRTLDENRDGTLADRLALTLARAANHGYAGLTVEHARNTGGLDRSQALFVYRRAIGPRSLLDGSALVQRDEASNLGATAEAALERPLAGSLSWLAGLGAAYLERGAKPAGEGVLRLGLSRRLRGTGWSARVETRLPFSIGMERSELNRQVFALDVGQRFNWSDLGGLGSVFHRDDARGATGEIEGTVRVLGEPRGGIDVLVDGESRGTTRADGTFVIHGVPPGETLVTLDPRSLDPGFDVDGERTRAVAVTPGITAHLDFAVARFSSFQGALVRCDGERLLAVKGARVTFSSAATSRTVTTSVVGSFQVDRVPPGTYDLVVDPESAGGSFPALRLDLVEDVFGYVWKLDCSDSEGDSTGESP